jgi:hypothetical protein
MTIIGKADVEIVNSLQVQNAEKCLYFHEIALGEGNRSSGDQLFSPENAH